MNDENKNYGMIFSPHVNAVLDANPWIVDHFKIMAITFPRVTEIVISFFCIGETSTYVVVLDSMRQGPTSGGGKALFTSLMPDDAMGDKFDDWVNNGGFAKLSAEQQVLIRLKMAKT